MFGAIIGDIAGSRYEFANTRDYNFEMFSEGNDFTDDTICTIAVADCVLQGWRYDALLLEWCRKYPHPMGGYGLKFNNWIHSRNLAPYGSFGNGSAMRVSPVAWGFDTKEEVLEHAELSAEITHNHPEGIKGAQAVAAVIFALRSNPSAETIRNVGGEFYPDFWKAEYTHEFNETCQGTVPLCLKLAMESTSFEDAIRRAVSWGGDSDTIGAIVGSIAEAMYEVPEKLKIEAILKLPNDMLKILEAFEQKYLRKPTKESLLKCCRYYHGEELIPENKHSYLAEYEHHWINEQINGQPEYWRTLEYCNHRLKDFELGDKAPMSLKALLFNRWCHWGGWANPEGFKEWYEEYYVDGK